jgi:hypothetical protein
MKTIEENTKDCLKYLKEKHDLTYLSIEKIVRLVLEWGEKNAMEYAAQCYQLKLEREAKQKEIEVSREDYKEEVDENGRTWYIETHWSHQRQESRKLSPGDIIKFKNSRGNGDGIMLVGSFDFESDFAARSYYMIENWSYEDENKNTIHTQTRGHSFAPGIRAFSFATEEEINDFFNDIRKEGFMGISRESVFDFYFNSDFTPEEIKSKIAKYIE